MTANVPSTAQKEETAKSSSTPPAPVTLIPRDRSTQYLVTQNGAIAYDGNDRELALVAYSAAPGSVIYKEVKVRVRYEIDE